MTWLKAFDADTGDGIPEFDINLEDGQNSGIEALTNDGSVGKRFTRYKKVGGTRYRQIKPRDRQRENGDIMLDGWCIRTYASKLNWAMRKSNVCFIIATDQMEWYSPLYGLSDSYDSYDPEDVTGWTAGLSGSESSGNVSQSTDFVIGDYAVTYSQTSPSTNTYRLKYTPSSSWDLDAEYINFWMKSSLADDGYTNPRYYIYESTNNDYWNLEFSADTWTEQILDVSSPDGGSGTVDYTAIDYVCIQVTGKSTNFTLYHDLIGAYDTSSNGSLKREIPFWSIESGQIVKEKPTDHYKYRLSLKRTMDPPF